MRADHTICEEARILLGLDDPRVESHLAVCSSCRAESDMVRPILRSLRTGPVEAIPLSLDRSVRAALLGSAPVLPTRGRVSALISLSSATTVAAGVGILFLLADTYPMHQAFVTGALLAAGYVAITTVATLPLFVKARSHPEARRWT